MAAIPSDNPVATTSSGLFPQSFSMRLDAKIRCGLAFAQEGSDIFHDCVPGYGLMERGGERERGGRKDALSLSPALPLVLQAQSKPKDQEGTLRVRVEDVGYVDRQGELLRDRDRL